MRKKAQPNIKIVTIPLIKKLINEKYICTEEKTILDDENAIVVIKEKDTSNYVMIHERLVDGKLVEINRCILKGYYYGMDSVIKERQYYKVQKGNGEFDGLYDYKNGKFIIEKGIWKQLEFGRTNQILDKYEGVLALLKFTSDYEDDDVFSYINVVTGEKMVQSHSVSSGSYYAILNLDGTIRGNKLFRGSNFSMIEEIIDLDKYESLEAFKKEKKQLCNDVKKANKQAYYDMVAAREDNNKSIYLDSEVAKIVLVKKEGN